MKPIALLILASAWGCVFFAPSGLFSRGVQVVVFLGLGFLLSLVGFVSFYWDSHMLPDQQSKFVLICGLGTLASQLSHVLRLLADAADEEFPGGKRTGAETRSRRP